MYWASLVLGRFRYPGHVASTDLPRASRFRYEGFDIAPMRGEIRCSYSLDARTFTERIRIDSSPEDWARPSVAAAAQLVFLLAGVSYFKTAAPHVIDLGSTRPTPAEMHLLQKVYADGLAEFAYRNGLDLSDVVIEASMRPGEPVLQFDEPPTRKPLVPFGGGIDSIVVAEDMRRISDDTALFIVSPGGTRLDALEAAAATSRLPIVRADRYLDSQVLRSHESGFLNGHVPVTGILSAIAVTAATLSGRDAVVMSNESSASSPTVTVDGKDINHQWSKSLEFERLFRETVAETVGNVSYFSALRPFSELWVAERFATLPAYHLAFRSCNRAFHVEPERRLARWCGHCDKCCFIDLMLAAFLDHERLRAIFDDNEPLDNDELAPQFRALLGDPAYAKPFECVGTPEECRAASVLAAARPDRADNKMLRELSTEVLADAQSLDVDKLRGPTGSHFIEARYAPADLLV